MDICRSSVKGKAGRLLIRATIVGLNLGACIAIGITISNLDKWDKKTKKGDVWWMVAVWFNIMITQLILSASGVCLYFMGKFCTDQSNWLMISGIYNLVNSILIIYAYLLGSQQIFNNCYKKGMGIRGSCKWNTKLYAALAGTIICILVSILNFFAAFYPFALSIKTGSTVEKGGVASEVTVKTTSDPKHHHHHHHHHKKDDVDTRSDAQLEDKSSEVPSDVTLETISDTSQISHHHPRTSNDKSHRHSKDKPSEAQQADKKGGVPSDVTIETTPGTKRLSQKKKSSKDS